MPDAPPPLPPPPETPREPEKPNPLFMLGAIALLLVAASPAFFLAPDDGGVYTISYKIGRLIGAVLFGIVLGYFLWWLFRRSSPRPLPKWSPWVFVIAAGMALVSLGPDLVSALRDGTEAIEATEQETEPAYEGPAESFFIEPPGYRYKELTADVKDQLQAQFTSDEEAAAAIEEFDGRQVLSKDGPVGATIVILMNVPQESWDESQAGFIAGFEDSAGAELQSISVAGRDALGASNEQGTFIFLLDRNLVIEVFAFDEDIAMDLAEGQVPALSD